MTDVAGCLQLPPGTESNKSLTTATLFLNSNSSHPVLAVPKRQFLSLEESQGFRTLILRVSLHTCPHLYPRVSAPLSSSSTWTYTSAPVFTAHFPVQHTAMNVPKRKPDLVIHLLIAFQKHAASSGQSSNSSPKHPSHTLRYPLPGSEPAVSPGYTSYSYL